MSARSVALLSTLSVVVIGRNEGARLERCLISVQSMTRGDWNVEIIYVDSGSTDASLQVAAHLGALTIALHSERPTAALGRNAGWKAATGEIVLFLDGDTELQPGFVREALEAFSDPLIAVVWGHRRELHPERSLYNRVLDLDWMYKPGPAPFCGGDALMRRDVLDEVHGFDAGLIAGEEPELCRRILAQGYQVLHVDLAMTMHDLAITGLAQYWKRAARAGHAFAEVSERFAATAHPFWDAEARRNRLHASGLCVAAVGVAVLCAALRSAIPLAVGACGAGLLVSRTAWKARWKSKDIWTLLLYGGHSHLQQLPIYWGQLQYRRNRRAGKSSGLLEYKQR